MPPRKDLRARLEAAVTNSGCPVLAAAATVNAVMAVLDGYSLRELQPCGTWAAYQRHVANREPVDEACRDACTRNSARNRKQDPEAVRLNNRASYRRQRARKSEAVSDASA